MSWDAYVSNMEGEGCMYSGFFDQKGNKWAESQGACLKITPNQIEHVVKGIQGAVDLQGEGARLGDRKFLLVQKTDSLAVLKQLGGDSNDKIMACVSLTKTGVCVGASAAGEKEKCSRMSTEKYADYLRGLNY